MNTPYCMPGRWDGQMPRALVVACSDSRFLEELQGFLHLELGLARYDRFYVPGGGGALAADGLNTQRAEQLRQECRFLIMAHEIEDLFLVFHGPAEDGPVESLCGDYKRRLQHTDGSLIRRQQERDALELAGVDWGRPVSVHVWRCEVDSKLRVHFVRMPVSAPGLGT